MIHLSDIVDRHKGEPFLVCGTGPSIEQYPREFYVDWPGIIIGVNDIKDLFVPDYWFNIHEIANAMISMADGMDKIAYSFFNPSTQISSEKNGQLSIVGTIALAAMTAAYQMGAGTISLIGIDLKVKPSQSHFGGCSSFYDPGHFIAKAPELEATVRTFKRAYALYASLGVEVTNLSHDSLLPESNKDMI